MSAVFEGAFVLALQFQELGGLLFKFVFRPIALFRDTRKPLSHSMYLNVEFLELNELSQFRAHRGPPFLQCRVYYIQPPILKVTALCAACQISIAVGPVIPAISRV